MYDLYLPLRTPRNVLSEDALLLDLQLYSWERFDEDDEDDDEFSEGLPGYGGLPTAAGAAPATAAGAAVAAGHRAAGYGLEEVMNEANDIVREANDEAERIIQEARRKAQGDRDRIYQQALEQARAEVGEATSPENDAAADELRQAAESLQQAGLAFVHMAQQLQEAYENRLIAIEADEINRAFAIARRVIDREIQTQPDIVLDHVREALSRLTTGEVTVRLNPADLPVVQQALADLRSERGGSDPMTFEVDPNVERGGCVVVGESGTINTEPRSKLEQLRTMAEG